jgi:hypothetical protein
MKKAILVRLMLDNPSIESKRSKSDKTIIKNNKVETIFVNLVVLGTASFQDIR